MEQEQPKGRDLALTETGSFALVSLADQMAFAARLIKEKMISETFQTPQQVIIGFQYAKALKMSEIIALRLMYVVNGRPCLYAEGPLSLCQRSGLVSSIKEFFVDEHGDEISFKNKNLKHKVYGSVTQIGRRNDPEIQEDFFTLDDLAQAGIDKGKYGRKDIWQKYERLMLRYKARSIALKSKFPEQIAGIPIAEYDEHFSPETPEVKVVKSVAEDLNKAYSSEDEIPKNSEPGIIEINPESGVRDL